MTSVWAYLVVSSAGQAESLPAQRQWAEETAQQNGWEITRIFGEGASGVSSGKDGVRKLLAELLEELRALPRSQRPRRILMVRIDRLGRGEGLETIGALAEIRKLGTMVHTRDDGDIKLERASDSVLPAVKSILAAIENEVRADRVRAGIVRRRALGLHIGTVPFGVVLVGGRATVYEPEAAIVREIFERAAEGWGYAKIARSVAHGAQAKRRSDGSEERVDWKPTFVRSILTSRTIRELVVDPDLARAAMRARGLAFRERHPARHPWPLRGAVRCTCGKLLSGHVGGAKVQQYRYYFCRWHSIEKGQTHPAHRADELEAGFMALLRDLAARPDLAFEPEPRDDEALRKRERDAKAHIDELERRRQRAWTLADDGTLTGAQLRERLDEIAADKERAREELDAAGRAIDEARRMAQSIDTLRSIMDDLIDLWPVAPLPQRQDMAQAVAALPSVRGLWAHPERRGRLMSGVYVAKEGLIELKNTTAPQPNRPIQSAIDQLSNVCSQGNNL